MSTADQPSSDSLTAALSKARIPSANHGFIRDFTNAVGIADYQVVEASKTYIRATRRDGLPDLHIYYGYTTGFTTEEEISRVAAGAVRGPSSRKGTLYVEHPETKVRPRSTRSADIRREAAFCDCGMQKSVTGVCSSCD
jgi:hypothetical protein